MMPQRPRVVLYGNCQSEWLDDALSRHPRLTERFELIHIASNYRSAKTDLLQQPAFLATCAFVVWQTAAGCQPPAFVAALPKTCRQIRYPTFCFKALWPLHTRDARNVLEPGFSDGRYPLGDRLLLRLMEEGVPVEDLAKRYLDTDLNTVVNLERFTKMSFAELRHNDRQSDIAVAPLIESLYPQRRTFAHITHPTLLLLNHLARCIASLLLEQAMPDRPEEFSCADEMLGDQQIPVHPQVADHLGLAWYRPDLKYDYGTAQLTLEEYVRAYATYERIPFGEFPDGWLQRARRALQAGRHDVAVAILRQARRVFSGNPEVCVLLFKSLHALGQVKEAAWALTQCINVIQPPLQANPLRFELGKYLLQNRLAADARRLFADIVSLDPAHAAARQLLFQLEAQHLNSALKFEIRPRQLQTAS